TGIKGSAVIQLGRFVCINLIVVLFISCTVLTPAAPTATIVPTRPSTQTPLPSQTPTQVALSPTTALPEKPIALQVRFIHDTTTNPQAMIDIITTTAQLTQQRVTVDVRSPDGTYVLAMDADPSVLPDVWIGSEYDLQQLVRLGVVATDTVPIQVAHYRYIDDALTRNAGVAAQPLALRNYLVSIGNSEFLDTLPDTTADVMSIGASIRGRVRYKMAYSWPEGRWFAMMLDQLGAARELTQTTSILPDEMLMTAFSSLDEMRTLGPRDATTYVESTSDFINWYVPYTIDGDAAIRRYEKYADDLPLRFAAPPIYSASGARLMPAVDVVYAIVPVGLSAQRRADVDVFVRGLQSPNAQTALFRAMRWIPVDRSLIEAGNLADDPLFVALQPFMPVFQTQSYDEITLCRWDAYEQVLPLVLLNTIRVQAGVTAVNNALQACIIEL
ncbi:MAG: hypothetical protein ACKO83_05990, partial [Roseiflexaceae bacterium]